MRVLTLLPVIGDPRDSKRVDMLLNEGLHVEVAAFDRLRSVGRPLNCPVTTLGQIHDGQYLRRCVVFLSSIPEVIRMSRRADIIYASGQDLALLGLVASIFARVPVVLEVGDIREIQTGRRARSQLARLIDCFITDHVSFLVVTSEKFISGYYRPYLNRTPTYVCVENKLEPSEIVSAKHLTEDDPGRPRDNTLVLGWFGVLRFQWCVDALRQIVLNSRRPVRVLLAGYSAGGVDLTPLTSLTDRVEHIPRYRSPEDLPDLYGKIDVVWGCYAIPGNSSRESNSSWARTNRFYEACAFGKPLIVLEGTGDADAVASLGVGLVLPHGDIPTIVSAVENISDVALSRWKRASDELPPHVYTYSVEARQLVSSLTEAVSRSNGGEPPVE